MCSYRGPDFENIFVNDLVTLGHNLLSITDNPNNGKQPWISPKGIFWYLMVKFLIIINYVKNIFNLNQKLLVTQNY